MTLRPERLDSEKAEDLAGELFERAVLRARRAGLPDLSWKLIGEAMGYGGDDADRHVREHRKGTRPITLDKLLKLFDAYPTVARAYLGELAAWQSERGTLGPTNRLTAVDNVVTEVLAFAADAHEVRRDNVVDDHEGERLSARGDRMRKALDTLDAVCAPARGGAQ